MFSKYVYALLCCLSGSEEDEACDNTTRFISYWSSQLDKAVVSIEAGAGVASYKDFPEEENVVLHGDAESGSPCSGRRVRRKIVRGPSAHPSRSLHRLRTMCHFY